MKRVSRRFGCTRRLGDYDDGGSGYDGDWSDGGYYEDSSDGSYYEDSGDSGYYGDSSDGGYYEGSDSESAGNTTDWTTSYEGDGSGDVNIISSSDADGDGYYDDGQIARTGDSEFPDWLLNYEGDGSDVVQIVPDREDGTSPDDWRESTVYLEAGTDGTYETMEREDFERAYDDFMTSEYLGQNRASGGAGGRQPPANQSRSGGGSSGGSGGSRGGSSGGSGTRPSSPLPRATVTPRQPAPDNSGFFDNLTRLLNTTIQTGATAAAIRAQNRNPPLTPSVSNYPAIRSAPGVYPVDNFASAAGPQIGARASLPASAKKPAQKSNYLQWGMVGGAGLLLLLALTAKKKPATVARTRIVKV